MVHQGADSAPGLQALDQGTQLLAGLNLVGLSEELLLLPLGQVGKSLIALGCWASAMAKPNGSSSIIFDHLKNSVD